MSRTVHKNVLLRLRDTASSSCTEHQTSFVELWAYSRSCVVHTLSFGFYAGIVALESPSGCRCKFKRLQSTKLVKCRNGSVVNGVGFKDEVT